MILIKMVSTIKFHIPWMGRTKPVFLKYDLEDAMPFLKKNNLKHAEYATKSVQELDPGGGTEQGNG